MPFAILPIPVIVGVMGVLFYAALSSLFEFAIIFSISFAIGSACYFAMKFLLNRATHIDRMEVKFLSGVLSILVMVTSIIYIVNENV